MNQCNFSFSRDRDPCQHFVPEGADTCIWHNVAIDKSAPYVRELLAQALRHHNDLEEAHLAGLSWPGARLAGARLRGADLRDADLSGADLKGADLRQSILRRANLQGSDLSEALLTGADLTETNLHRATLVRADLCNTTIDQTNFVNADLRSVDLAGSQVVSFSWNRLTRFQQVRGLEARLDDGAGEHGRDNLDNSATQVFIAPLALGNLDHDEDLTERYAHDPEYRRTRVYRSDIMQGPDLLSATSSNGSLGYPFLLIIVLLIIVLQRPTLIILRCRTMGPVMMLTKILLPPFRMVLQTPSLTNSQSYPAWRWLALAACLLAMATTGTSVYLFQQLQQKPIPQPADPVIITELPDAQPQQNREEIAAKERVSTSNTLVAA